MCDIKSKCLREKKEDAENPQSRQTFNFFIMKKLSSLGILIILASMLCFAASRTTSADCSVTFELSCTTLSNVPVSCDFTLRELQNIANSMDATFCP